MSEHFAVCPAEFGGVQTNDTRPRNIVSTYPISNLHAVTHRLVSQHHKLVGPSGNDPLSVGFQSTAFTMYATDPKNLVCRPRLELGSRQIKSLMLYQFS